jgi:hypothetical protein
MVKPVYPLQLRCGGGIKKTQRKPGSETMFSERMTIFSVLYEAPVVNSYPQRIHKIALETSMQQG